MSFTSILSADMLSIQCMTVYSYIDIVHGQLQLRGLSGINGYSCVESVGLSGEPGGGGAGRRGRATPPRVDATESCGDSNGSVVCARATSGAVSSPAAPAAGRGTSPATARNGLPAGPSTAPPPPPVPTLLAVCLDGVPRGVPMVPVSALAPPLLVAPALVGCVGDAGCWPVRAGDRGPWPSASLNCCTRSATLARDEG